MVSVRRAKALIFAVGVGVAGSAMGATVLTDNFDSYTTASNLVGQDSWIITGTSTLNPIQVVSPGVAASANQASLVATGQDAYKAFSSPVAHTDGSSIYTGMDVTVSAVGTGDYSIHLSDPVGTTSFFYQRLFAKTGSTGSTYNLGILETSGTGGVTQYGGDLNIGQTYHVVVGWNFVAGPTNDTFNIYVNPTSNTEGLNVPYVGGHTWSSVTAEPTQLSEFNFRQGSTGAAPSETVDNVSVSDSFSDVAGIPEPGTLGLISLGSVALLRRRRKMA